MIVKLNDVPIADNMTCSWDISKKYKDLSLPDGFKLPDNIDLEAVVPPSSTIEIEKVIREIKMFENKYYNPPRLPPKTIKPWWQFWKR